MSVYEDGDNLEWFQREWAKSGKKLDMGKCCVRFKKLEDLSLETIAKAIRRMPARKFIVNYEAALRANRRQPSTRAAKSSPPEKTKKPSGAATRRGRRAK